MRGGDHFIAWPNPTGQQRQIERCRTRSDPHGFFRSDIFSKDALKISHLLAQDKTGVVQHSLNRRIYLGLDADILRFEINQRNFHGRSFLWKLSSV